MFTTSILLVILVISMILALLMVVIGVIAMAKNGNFNKKHSNKLMRMRVLFQGIAVCICCHYIPIKIKVFNYAHQER